MASVSSWFTQPSGAAAASGPQGAAGLDPAIARLLQQLGLLPGEARTSAPNPPSAPVAPTWDWQNQIYDPNASQLNALSPMSGEGGTPSSPDASGGSLASTNPGAAAALQTALGNFASPGEAISRAIGAPTFGVMGQQFDPLGMLLGQAIGRITGAVPGLGMAQNMANLISQIIGRDLTAMNFTPAEFGMKNDPTLGPMSPAQAVHNSFLQALSRGESGVGPTGSQSYALNQGGTVDANNPYGGFRGLTGEQIAQNISNREEGLTPPAPPDVNPPDVTTVEGVTTGPATEGNTGTGASPAGVSSEGGEGGGPGGGDSGD